MCDSLSEFALDVFHALLVPVLAARDPSERVYFLYLAAAGALAAFVWLWRFRGKVSLARFLFPKEILSHPSALFDLRFMIGRTVLGLFLSAPLLVSSAVAATWLSQHLERLYASPLPLPAAFGLLFVTVSAFVAEDFARYWVHRATHQVPWLWELHKVHHSAEVLTPFTIYRTHPIEGFLMRSGSALGLAVGAGSAAWFFGAPLSLWEVFGVQGLSVLWNLTGANLRHSHVWLRYPPWLEHLFISPAQHQLHHSRDPAHFNRNYGSEFALWDWLFGSLLVARKRPRLEFGLAPEETNHDLTVLSALLSPLKHASLRLFRATSPSELKTPQGAQEFAHPSFPKAVGAPES